MRVDVKTGAATPLLLPKSKMVIFHLADNSQLIIRPSGTEPKIKIYCSVASADGSGLEARATTLLEATHHLLK